MTDAAGKGPVELTANIVSAYLSNNPTQASEIPNLISQVHAALLRVSSGRPEAPLEPAKPAVSVKKSMTPEYLVCLEDGKQFKSLKRHLRTQYNMTPEQYREKWGFRSTIRWSHRIMPWRVRNSRKRWASASSSENGSRNSAFKRRGNRFA